VTHSKVAQKRKWRSLICKTVLKSKIFMLIKVSDKIQRLLNDDNRKRKREMDDLSIELSKPKKRNS
jgi:recombinational DNA repair protein RecT